MGNDYQNIEKRLKEIIADFKSGKNVTEDLSNLTSGDALEALQDYFLGSENVEDAYFVVPLADIPIPEGDQVLDYFVAEDLAVQGFEEKLERLSSRLETAVDMDTRNFIEGQIIDDVYVCVRGQMEGQSGPRIYQVSVTNNMKEFGAQCKREGLLLCYFGGGCLNCSDKELVEIWDSFIAKVGGG